MGKKIVGALMELMTQYSIRYSIANISDMAVWNLVLVSALSRRKMTEVIGKVYLCIW